MFELIFNSSSDAALITRLSDGVVIELNIGFIKLTGFTREETIGKSILGINLYKNPSDRQRIVDELAKYRFFENLEVMFLKKDGSLIIGSVSAKVIVFQGVSHIISITRDITDRKLFEEEKLKADTILRTLSQAIEQSPVTTVITDLAGNIEFVNPKFTETTGYTAEEAIGQNSRILKSGDRPSAEYKDLWDTILSGKNWHGIFQNKKKNGEIYWESAVISPVKDERGVIRHFLAVKENITERKKSDQTLLEINRRYERAVTGTTDGIWDWNIPTGEDYHSPRYHELLGYAPNEIPDILDGFHSLIHPDDLPLVTTAQKAHLEKGVVYNIDLRMKTKQGYYKWFNTRGQAEWDVNGKPLNMSGSITDISERKKTEEEIISSNARLQRLVNILEHPAKTIQEFLDYSLEQAIQLTKSRIGYIYHYNEDKKVFIINSWSKEVMPECTVANPQSSYELDKTGIWGEAVRQRKPIIVNDFQSENPLKKGVPDGHVELKKFMTVPIFRHGLVVGVVGLANKETDYDETDVFQVSLLMEAVWSVVDRMQAEESLRESEEHIRLLLNSTAEAIYGIDKDGNCTFCNISCLKLLGYESPDELIGKNMHHQIHHSHSDGTFFDVNDCSIFRAFKKGVNNHVDNEVLWRSNGDSFPAEYWSYPQYRDGEIVGAVVTFLDISERRQAELAIKESEQKYRLLVDNAFEGIVIVNLEGKILFANNSIIKTYEYENADEIVGQNIFNFIAPEYVAQAIDDFSKVIQGTGGEVAQSCGITSKGKRIWLESTGKIIDYEGIKADMISVRDITAKNQFEEDLRESELKYRLLTENTADVIWVLNITKGKFSYISPSVFQLRGFTAEEAMLETLEDSLTPASVLAVKEAIGRDTNNFLSNPEIPNYYINELQQYCKNGQIIWIEVSTQYRYSPSGDIEIVGVSRNIEERKKTENALRASEEKFKAIIDTSPDGIAITALDGTIQFVTAKVASMWGYDSGQELLGRNTLEFVHSSYHEKAFYYMTEMFNGNLTGAAEYLMVRKDGSTFYSEANANILRDAYNNPTGVLYIERDITERKQAEDVLRESERRFRNIMEYVNLISAMLDINGNITFANDYFLKLTGWQIEEVLGKNWFELFIPPETEVRHVLLQGMKEGKVPLYNQNEIITRNGERRIIDWSNTLLRDAQGNNVGIAGIGVDITARKQAEKILYETNASLEAATIKANEMANRAEAANKAKSIFLANMSHEIRTPLNAIIGFTQLMNRDKSLTDKQKEYNNSIISAGEHLLSLINDILELSKIEAGRIVLNPANVDLHALLNDMRMIFKERTLSKHLQFIFEIAENLPHFVVIDDSKLRQIFINLIGNAVKFTHEGGIAIRSRVDKLNDHKRLLFVEIQDSGPGISEAEQKSLFKHFVQTSSGINKGSGTGLGLALSRELALLMGGNITVKSEVGQGSLFTFFVEIKEGVFEDGDKKTSNRVICIDKGEKNYRILVVDDKKENLQVVVNLLNLVGFETNEAINGEDAIAKFEQWSPDLILMDLRMPVMDGYEATRRIKSTEKGKQTPIIVLTASTFEGEQKRIDSMGIQGYICKPFRENELFGTIAKVLGIQYTYEDSSPSSHEKYLNDEEVIAENLSKLPNLMVVQMLEAIAIADLRLLKKYINSIPKDNSELAQYLMLLAENYDYEHLKKLLNIT